jgi:hypothetical protein
MCSAAGMEEKKQKACGFQQSARARARQSVDPKTAGPRFFGTIRFPDPPNARRR